MKTEITFFAGVFIGWMLCVAIVADDILFGVLNAAIGALVLVLLKRINR